jgi:hypothetical protein
MPARKSLQELLAENHKREQEIKAKAAERTAAAKIKLDTSDAALDKRIAALQSQKAENQAKRETLDAEVLTFSSTQADEV